MPPGEERVTTAELGRRLDEFKRDVKDDIAHLADQVSRLSFVHPETLDTKLLLEQTHRLEIERRVQALETANEKRADEASSNRRIAITGLVFPVLVAVAAAIIIASIGIR